MASRIDDLPTSVIEALVQVAYRRALVAVGQVSTQLADAMIPVVINPHRGMLLIPQYFARFVHDGTGPSYRSPDQSPYIWYKDPGDDPRLDNGKTPHRVSQLRHLTSAYMKSEAFQRGVQAGDIIITRKRSGTLPNPFFVEGMAGTDRAANFAAGSLVQDHFRDQLRDILEAEADLDLRV